MALELRTCLAILSYLYRCRRPTIRTSCLWSKLLMELLLWPQCVYYICKWNPKSSSCYHLGLLCSPRAPVVWSPAVGSTEKSESFRRRLFCGRDWVIAEVSLKDMTYWDSILFLYPVASRSLQSELFFDLIHAVWLVNLPCHRPKVTGPSSNEMKSLKLLTKASLFFVELIFLGI